MTTIVCVKTGSKYPSEYVNKLARSVRRNGYNRKISCITDNSDGIDTNIVDIVKIRDVSYSWWDKIQLFNWDHGIDDDLLYYDVDMITVNDITCFLEHSGGFSARTRFDDNTKINSTLMYIPKGFGVNIWEEWNKYRHHISDKFGWDSKYLDYMIGDKFIKFDILFPNAIVSYKLEVRKYGLKPYNKVVSFHGRPNPDEVNDEFVKLHWK